MAIISRGILGGFKGKVANVVGTSWKGRAVMKSLPLSVANPRSAGQVTQRSKFSNVVLVASGMLSSWIRPLWNPFAGNVSGYNKFVSVNTPLASMDLNQTIEAMEFTKGNITPFTFDKFGVVRSDVAAVIEFDWSTELQGTQLMNDRIFGFCMNKITGEIYGAAELGQRFASEGTLSLSRKVTLADTPFVGICALRLDSSDVSNTTTATVVS